MKAILFWFLSAVPAMWVAAGIATAGTLEDCLQDENVELKIKACTTMIGREPRRASHYIERGNGRYNSDDYEKARADYSKAIELDPKSNIAHHNRCAAYNNLKQPDLAIQDCNKAISLDAKDRIAFNNRCHSHWLKKQYHAAAEDCRRSIAIKPDYDRAWASLCYSLDKLSDYPAVIEECSRGIALLPGEGWLYMRRARAHLHTGNIEQALADADKANVLEDQEVEILTLRGQIHEKAGRQAKAIEDYRAALKLKAEDDDDRDAQRLALDRLTALVRQ